MNHSHFRNFHKILQQRLMELNGIYKFLHILATMFHMFHNAFFQWQSFPKKKNDFDKSFIKR